MKRKIIIITNHFQQMDGICSSAINMANALAKLELYNITICPLFLFDRSKMCDVDSRVEIKPVFRFYFRGFQKIIGLIPTTWLHSIIIGDKYDIEIGFCMKMPIQLIASVAHKKHSSNKKMYFAWMHGYDKGLSLVNEYKKIGRVICVSKSSAERLKDESKHQFSVDYAYNVIDEEKIIEFGREHINIEKPKEIVFCSVGRFTHEKGFIRLAKVAKLLSDKGYKFSLWIIGDGPEKDDVEKIISTINSKNVVLIGSCKNPHAYTSKCDVYVCSSFSEGYSTACTEAMILGVPIITTDVSGGKEMVEEARAGMVVDNSEEGLFEGMKNVLEKPHIIDNWKNELAISKTLFSKDNRIAKLISVLDLDNIKD